MVTTDEAALASAPAPGRFGTLTLCGALRDPARELAFRTRMLPDDRKLGRRVAWIAALLFASFVPSDFFALGGGAPFAIAASSRLLSAAGFLAAAVGAARSTDPGRNDRLWIGATSLVTAATLAIGLARPSRWCSRP